MAEGRLKPIIAIWANVLTKLAQGSTCKNTTEQTKKPRVTSAYRDENRRDINGRQEKIPDNPVIITGRCLQLGIHSGDGERQTKRPSF
jgi:hypothetical protein